MKEEPGGPLYRNLLRLIPGNGTAESPACAAAAAAGQEPLGWSCSLTLQGSAQHHSPAQVTGQQQQQQKSCKNSMSHQSRSQECSHSSVQEPGMCTHQCHAPTQSHPVGCAHPATAAAPTGAQPLCWRGWSRQAQRKSRQLLANVKALCKMVSYVRE